MEEEVFHYICKIIFDINIDGETRRISSFEGELSNNKIKILKLPTIIGDIIYEIRLRI